MRVLIDFDQLFEYNKCNKETKNYIVNKFNKLFCELVVDCESCPAKTNCNNKITQKDWGSLPFVKVRK